MAGEAPRVDAARGPLPWPAAGCCGSSCWKATHGTLRSLLRQGPRCALPSSAGSPPWHPLPSRGLRGV